MVTNLINFHILNHVYWNSYKIFRVMYKDACRTAN